jgi:hypothetical protein
MKLSNFLFLIIIFMNNNIFGYMVKTIGKKKIISLKPEMTRYCKSNHLYSNYDRQTCLQTLSDHPISYVDTKYEEKIFTEEYENSYRLYKLEKEKSNNKIKQLHSIYMAHQFL